MEDFIKACKDGNLEMVKLLIENGIDINHKNNHGNTGFISPCLCVHLKIIELLIINSADINHKNNNGDNGLSIYIQFKRNI